MNKLLCLILALILGNIAVGQKTDLENFQGFWFGAITSDLDADLRYYRYVRGNNQLALDYEGNELKSVYTDFIGFSDTKQEEFTFNQIKENGKYVCFCEEEKNTLLSTCINFDAEEPSYSFAGSDVYDYYKVEGPFAPEVYNDLFQWDRTHNTSYARDFFDFDIRRIVVNKSIIYSSPDIATRQYVVMNDVIQILSEKDDWYRIRYYGKKITEGWIKKSDTQKLNEPVYRQAIVSVSKAIINSSPENAGSMYLIKGDVVDILESKNEWFKIRFKGKKVVDGWVKKKDVMIR